MAKLRFNDLPPEVQKKMGMTNMNDLDYIQYYPQDLAYALGIGEIADMHVDIENNIQVLRLTIVPIKDAKYTTIRAPKGTIPKPQPQKQPRKPVKKPKTVGDAVTDKVVSGLKTWWGKKDKPQFMKDLE
jgi:hypothetical protein